MPKSSGDPGPTTAATRRRSSPPKVRFTVAPSLFHYEIGNPVDGGGTTGVVEALNKRQPPSCDNCRTRKLRCSGRPELIELGAEATATIPCDVSLSKGIFGRTVDPQLSSLPSSSIAENGVWTAHTGIIANEGDDEIEWWSVWLTSKEQESNR